MKYALGDAVALARRFSVARGLLCVLGDAFVRRISFEVFCDGVRLLLWGLGVKQKSMVLL